MARILRRILQLSRPERWLLLQAVVWNLGVRAGLSVCSFQRLVSFLRRFHRAGRAPESERLPDSCEWAVAAASRYVPRSTCLSRSLALQTMLGRRGLAAELRIGVSRDGAGPLDAHAWVELNGRKLLEGGDIERYRELPGLNARLNKNRSRQDLYARRGNVILEWTAMKIIRSPLLLTALLLAVALALGSGWLLITGEPAGAGTGGIAQQYRLVAVFVFAALVAALLIVHSLRGEGPKISLSDAGALPWWTDPLGAASFDGVFTVDENLLIRSANHGLEEMFGYSIRELVGHTLFRLIPADARFSGQETLAQVDGHKGVVLQVKGKHKDETEFPLELRLTEFERGSTRMYLGVCRRANEEDSARAADSGQRAQPADWAGQFMARVGKDINHAATTILGYTGLALDALDEHDSRRVDLRVVKAAGEHIAELSQILQILGRTPGGAGEKTDLHQWIREFQESVPAEAGGQEQIRLALEAEDPLVTVRRSYLRIVLVYLLRGVVGKRGGAPELTIRTRGKAAGIVSLEVIRPGPLPDSKALAYEVARGILAKSGCSSETAEEPDGRISFSISLPLASRDDSEAG